MVSSCRVSVQWQKTCSNRKNTIQVKLWKTSMKRQPCGIIRVSKSERVSCRTTEELGVGYKVNERSIEEHEKAIWQEKVKSQGLKVGDNIWLENKNIQLNQLSKKLDQKRYRPFRILKNIGLGAFQLELPEEWAIHNMFNEDLLTRYNELQFKEQHIEPAPVLTIINEEEEYEVEEVQKYRKPGREMQYLVHWKGYENKHDQWIAETGLPHAKEAIEDYWS